MKNEFIEKLKKESPRMLQFQYETLKRHIELKESSIYSDILDVDGNKTVSPASLTDKKRITARYDYFGICIDALDLEEQMQEQSQITEADAIKANYERVKREITLLMFHMETLKVLIESKRTQIDIDLSKCLADEESIKVRYEYYTLRQEAIMVQSEINAKESLIAKYEPHVDRGKKEIRQLDDTEIDEVVSEMMDLVLTGADKQKAVQWRNDWEARHVVGIEQRFDFYTGIKRFIAQIKG